QDGERETVDQARVPVVERPERRVILREPGEELLVARRCRLSGAPGDHRLTWRLPNSAPPTNHTRDRRRRMRQRRRTARERTSGPPWIWPSGRAAPVPRS